MTIDNAITRYRITIINLPDPRKAIDALAELFSGVRAHKDYNTLLEEFAKAIPSHGRAQHVEAMEVLVLDLAECDRAEGSNQ